MTLVAMIFTTKRTYSQILGFWASPPRPPTPAKKKKGTKDPEEMAGFKSGRQEIVNLKYLVPD